MKSSSRLTSTATAADLDPDEKMVWIIAFGFLLVVATVGNSMVTWFIIARRRLAKAYSCYMLSLTMSDFAMLYFECVFNFIYILEGNWRYGTMYCIIDNFLSEMTTAGSIFILTATSYDRYLAIVKPFSPRSTRKGAIWTVVSCWLLAFFLAAPTLIYSDEFLQTVSGDVVLCDLVWPEQDVVLNSSVFRTFVFIVTYAIPVALMAYWNVRIGLVLSGSIVKLNLEGQHHQTDLLTKKRKHLAEGMWAILIIFGICWLPYQTFIMYQTFAANLDIQCKRFCMAVYWLAVSNAAVNPFLFYRLDKQFQEYMKTFFNRFTSCCTLKSQQNIQVPALPQKQ